MAKVIQVIVTEEYRGAGIVGDPYRNVPQYWDFEGELLAEKDDFDKHETKILVLNSNIIKTLSEREELEKVLRTVVDTRNGRRLRLNKARTLVEDTLAALGMAPLD